MPIPVFNAEQHSYTTPDGQRLCGVTSVLGEYIEMGRMAVNTVDGSMISLDVLRAAADYGTAVHKLLELALLHGPDSFSYPEVMSNAVKQIRQFIADYQPTVIMCEQPLYDIKRMVAGTPDLFFTSPKIKGNKRVCCLDAKTGIGRLTGPQTAEYVEMFRQETGEKGLIDRYKLRLPKDSETYKIEKLTNKNDLKFFDSKLFCRQFEATLRRSYV